MDANQLLGWYKYGGSEALYRELLDDILKRDIAGCLTGPMPTQPLNGFKRPVKSPEDLENLTVPPGGAVGRSLHKELGAAAISCRPWTAGSVVADMSAIAPAAASSRARS